MDKNIKKILDFWFKECKPEDWFKKDTNFDQKIKFKFINLIEKALNDELIHWAKSPKGSLALILLLDQFTRNIYRGKKNSFCGDEKALKISLNSIKKNYLNSIKPDWCQFFLMPLMHSEDLKVQEKSISLFEKHTSQNVYQFALKHKAIIEKFGRFPHRNIILGRKSNSEEILFLKQPKSSF